MGGRGGRPDCGIGIPHAFAMPMVHGGRFISRDIVFTRDGEGAVRQIIGSAEDITDRKRFETQLRESEVQLRALIERVPGMTYTATASYPMAPMYVSPQCEALLGYSAYEIISESSIYFDQIIHVEDRTRVMAAFRRCIESGHPVDFEYRVITKDKQEKWLRDRAVLVRNDEGEPLFIQGIASDVTERRRQEQDRYDRLTRAWRLQSAILELATSSAILQGDWTQSLMQVGRATAEAMDVSRVSVWLLRDEGRALCCESLYLKDQDRCESGHTLLADAYPAYFEALMGGLAVDAHEAQTDPRTCEFSESYLKPLGITSMLDAPIRVAGRVVGVLCLEHVDAPRRWSADETSFAIAIADQVTHLIERRERLETELALTDVERRLRAVIANSPIVLFAIGRDGKFTVSEGRGLAQLGLRPGEVVGRNVFEMYADYPDILSSIRRALSGESFITETELDDLVFEIQYEPVWQGDQVVSVIGVATDITQRRFAERETERQREEFQTVLDNMPVRVIFKDAQNNILRVNRAVSDPLGVTPAEMANTPASRWYPDEADRYAAEDRRVIETGKPILGLIEPVHAGLEAAHWLHVDKYPLRDDEGAVVGVIFLAIDITDRVNAESALRRSEERYDLVLKGTSDGLWDWRIATNEVFYSPRFKELLGYGDHELAHHIEAFRDLIHPDERKAMWEGVERHLRERNPYDVEIKLRMRNGEYQWFRIRGQAVWSASGEALRMAGSIQAVHDRKQAELELFESRQLLEGVLNTIPVRIFWKDRQSNYLGCNAVFASDGGLKSHENVRGLTDYDMFTEENAELYRSDDRRVIDSGIPKLGYEEPQFQPDGQEHWLRTSKVPLKNPEGDIIGVLGTYEDVTERKRSEEALRRVAEGLTTATGEAFYRSLVQSLGEALGVRYAFIGRMVPQDSTKIETLAVYANGQVVDNMVYELGGTPCENVLVRERDTCIYAEGVAAQFPDDHLLVEMGVESYAGTPLADSTGQISGLLVVRDDKPFADPTMVENLLKVFGVRGAGEMERQASLDLLRQTELRFRTVFDQSPNGIVVLDVDAGKFIMANSNAARIYGLSRKEIMRVGPLETSPLTQPDGRASNVAAAQYIRAALEGTPQTFEWWHVNAEGQELPCEISLVQLPARDRNLLLATVTDIRERIEADHRQRQQQAELARVGRVIMAGELASGLAHELNQPLGAIANYSAACQYLIGDSTAVPAKARDMIRTMGVEAERAGQIIRHLRRLVERREVQQQAVDLSDLIVRTVDLVRPELRQHNVTVRLYLSQDLPQVAADPVQVEQIVLNLLLNAMEAIDGSKNEDRRVAVRCRQVNEREVEVLVRDTGPGVSGENPDRVFDPFYTTKTTGLGMGLHICRSIIESHNGRMWVRNHVRGGAEFGFALRLFQPKS